MSSSGVEGDAAISQLAYACQYGPLVLAGPALIKLSRLASQTIIPLSTGVLGAFFRHFIEYKPPKGPIKGLNASIECINCALFGIAFLGNSFEGLGSDEYGEEIADAWPDVLSWLTYYYDTRIKQKSNEDRKDHDSAYVAFLLSGVYNTLLQSSKGRDTIIPMEGSIEMLTKLWILQEPDLENFKMPTASCALEIVMQVYQASGRGMEGLKRVCDAADVEVGLLVEMMMKRIEAFLNAGAVKVYTEAIQVMATAMKTPVYRGYERNILMSMRAGFVFLGICLDSMNASVWISQAVEANFLKGFIACTPYIASFPLYEKEVTFRIITEVLPKYSVYQSVLQAVDTNMKEMRFGGSGGGGVEMIRGTEAIAAMQAFRKIELERYFCLKVLQMEKKYCAVCDNSKCQKVDKRHNFRRCSACRVSIYCSYSCQMAAWKSGEHKELCQLMAKQLKDGTPQPVSKSDTLFFHHLALRDAKRNRPELKKIASKEFPGVLLEDLVVQIDYTGYPPKFSLRNGNGSGVGGGGEPTKADLTKDDVPAPPNAGDTEQIDTTTQEGVDALETATASLTLDGPSPTSPSPTAPSEPSPSSPTTPKPRKRKKPKTTNHIIGAKQTRSLLAPQGTQTNITSSMERSSSSLPSSPPKKSTAPAAASNGGNVKDKTPKAKSKPKVKVVEPEPEPEAEEEEQGEEDSDDNGDEAVGGGGSEGDDEDEEWEDDDDSDDGDDDSDNGGVDEEGMKNLIKALGDDGLDELGQAQLQSLAGGEDSSEDEGEEEDEAGGNAPASGSGGEEWDSLLDSEEEDEEAAEGSEDRVRDQDVEMNSEDDEIPLDELDEDLDEDAVPHQKVVIDNTVALDRIRKTIQLDPSLPWTETLVVSYPETIEVDVNDDLNRELSLYVALVPSSFL
ncbi:hypothetical protein BDN72DRAFT_931992 [Pluteus cervinus]|uniref:Uncharacterized protein n=1 Tax=Pluteus cervinus TaxID=181527 RepID=A0ACD3AA71_9AGAR|nr:hypothetical protein BDN72DRAFT_931992 [Pluteus cervinus]